MGNEPVMEQAIGHLHMLVWFFPVIFFTAALIADICNYLGWSRALKIGHWLVIAGALSCIPAITTGLAAAVPFDQSDYLLQKHRYLGFATGISGSLYAGLRISTMIWKLPIKSSHFVFLSVLLLALVSWTCDYGGLLSHRE